MHQLPLPMFIPAASRVTRDQQTLEKSKDISNLSIPIATEEAMLMP